MRKTKKVAVLCILGILCLFSVSIFTYKYFFKSWTPYYQEKLKQGPRPLIIEVVHMLENADAPQKNALDIGAGVGNDTAFLLKNNWHVWANDKEAEAIKIISSRKDIEQYKSNLVLITASFVDIPWQELPQFNLVYAGFSLPFAQPKDFMDIWSNIKNVLLPGGVFAGHFFGPEHSAFNSWQKQEMSFFTEQQLRELFQEFEILSFETCYEKSFWGSVTQEFTVIARKL
jgi:SAM-dependent methyltransferase